MTNQEPQGDVPVEPDSSVPETVRPEGELTQRMRRVIVEQTPLLAREIASSIPEPPRRPVEDRLVAVTVTVGVFVMIALGKVSFEAGFGALSVLVFGAEAIPLGLRRLNRRAR